jgi:hypothetical protein
MNAALDTIYKSLNQLNVADLDKVMHQIIDLRQKKNPSILSKKESDLLKAINLGLPKELQSRYSILVKKRHNETLIDAEYEELLTLTEQVEKLDNQRLSYLLELAKLRNQSLDDVITSLELKPRLYVSQ